MAISRLSAQDAQGNGTAQNASATYPGATTSNNLLIAAVCAQDATGGATTITAGGSWTKVGDQTFAGQVRVSLFYKLSIGNETTITAHNSNASSIALDIFEYTGNANPIQTDGTLSGNNSSGSVSSLSTNSIATTNTSDLVFTIAAFSGTVGTSPSWNNATVIGSNLAGAGRALFCGENIISSAQSNYSDVAHIASAVAFWSTFIAAFQAAASGPPQEFISYMKTGY